jgi:hypothetical protein
MERITTPILLSWVGNMICVIAGLIYANVLAFAFILLNSLVVFTSQTTSFP